MVLAYIRNICLWKSRKYSILVQAHVGEPNNESLMVLNKFSNSSSASSSVIGSYYSSGSGMFDIAIFSVFGAFTAFALGAFTSFALGAFTAFLLGTFA